MIMETEVEEGEWGYEDPMFMHEHQWNSCRIEMSFWVSEYVNEWVNESVSQWVSSSVESDSWSINQSVNSRSLHCWNSNNNNHCNYRCSSHSRIASNQSNPLMPVLCWPYDWFRQGKHAMFCKYRQISNTSRTHSLNINVSRLVLQSYLPNLLNPGVKLRMKMLLEQRRQATSERSTNLLPTNVRLILEVWRYQKYNFDELWNISNTIYRTSIHWQIRRLVVGSRKVSKGLDTIVE